MSLGLPNAGRGGINRRRRTMQDFAGDPFGADPFGLAVEPVGEPMGETPAQAAAPTIAQTDLLTKLAPVVKELLDDSAVEDVEVLKAKIANHRRLRDASIEPVRTLYANKVRVLEAKLRAAKDAKRLEREEQQATRTWRVLGYTVTGTGIAVGAGVLALLVAGTQNLNRRDRGHR